MDLDVWGLERETSSENEVNSDFDFHCWGLVLRLLSFPLTRLFPLLYPSKIELSSGQFNHKYHRSTLELTGRSKRFSIRIFE